LDRKPEIQAPVIAKSSVTLQNLADHSLLAESKESEFSVMQGSSLDGVMRSNLLCDVIDKYSNLRR
jgi:hypothetical protein